MYLTVFKEKIKKKNLGIQKSNMITNSSLYMSQFNNLIGREKLSSVN